MTQIDEKRCNSCEMGWHDDCDTSGESFVCRCSVCTREAERIQGLIDSSERATASALDLEAIRKRAVTLSAFFDEYLESVKPSEVHETVADGGEWIEKPTGDLVCCACAEDPSECGETCLRLMATDASMSTHDVPALCDELERRRAENAKLREAANAVLRDFTPEHLDLIGVSMAGSKLRDALADLALRGGGG